MATDVSDGIKQAAGHPWFHHMSRVGLVARGLLYLLIGWLALQVAFGGGGQEADRKGALQEVAEKPGGDAILWLMAVGFAALALWQYAEALYGRPVPDGDKPTKRLASAARGVVYTAGFAATLAFAFGYQGRSSDQQSKTITARLMGEPGGRWLVLAVAAGFVVWGGVVIAHAVRRTFMEELRRGEMGRLARRSVQPLGIVGNGARGLSAPPSAPSSPTRPSPSSRTRPRAWTAPCASSPTRPRAPGAWSRWPSASSPSASTASARPATARSTRPVRAGRARGPSSRGRWSRRPWPCPPTMPRRAGRARR